MNKCADISTSLSSLSSTYSIETVQAVANNVIAAMTNVVTV